MNNPEAPSIEARVERHTGEWLTTIDRRIETESSTVVFGTHASAPAVVKVVKRTGDEWSAGPVLEAFEGRGVVRVLAHEPGAVLLERLSPATSLAEIAMNGDDAAATEILVNVIRRMVPVLAQPPVPTIVDWAAGFDRYLVSGDAQIPTELVHDSRQVYLRLCETQTQPRLLHGDLHHGNVLLDADRGWLAIDPKGVIGELEYEVGAALRNPYERPELFTDASTIMMRVQHFSYALGMDQRRLLAWCYAQAVLAAIWTVEDGSAIGPSEPWIALAATTRELTGRRR
jgi:streptomycin 6-kinase